MFVVATAGHVDHGKSTLVRALTGIDPDRLAEEHRRGMTIELGYVWTDLPAGRVAFVDVPGHERFLQTMLAGVGPVPAVLLVVAADEGWRRQTGEHVAALHALGIGHALLAVTRSDLADPAPVAADVRERLAGTPLAGLPWIAVSAVTGLGLDELRTALDALVRALPAPRTSGRTRLFVDRVFTVRGSGTVVTGTLQAGALTVGDRLELDGEPVAVRALESTGQSAEHVGAVARVAVNLRGVARDDVARGSALLTPDAWWQTSAVDVRLLAPAARRPSELVLHVGSAAVPVTVRELGDDHARLVLARLLPLEPGDRGVLRDPGRHAVAAGVLVLDVDPPPVRGRGAAARRTAELAAGVDAAGVLRRHGALRLADLRLRGWPDVGTPVGEWRVDPAAWQQWGADLRAAVRADAATGLASGGLPVAELAALLPDPALLEPLASSQDLVVRAGRVAAAGPVLPPGVATALQAVRDRLGKDPFAAPDTELLAALGLDRRALAVLADAGLVLRLPGDVVLLPGVRDVAVARLAGIGPFTVAQARQAWGTSRRVAVPLLEHLDGRGLTRRVDAQLRVLR